MIRVPDPSVETNIILTVSSVCGYYSFNITILKISNIKFKELKWIINWMLFKVSKSIEMLEVSSQIKNYSHFIYIWSDSDYMLAKFALFILWLAHHSADLCFMNDSVFACEFTNVFEFLTSDVCVAFCRCTTNLVISKAP